MLRWLRLAVVSLLGACGARPAASPPAAPSPSPPAARPAGSLAPGDALDVPGGARVRLVAVGHAPAAAELSLEGLGRPVSLRATELAPAWFRDHRVRLVALSPLAATPAWATLGIDRITETERPGPPRRVELARGGDLALDDGVVMRFHGHSSKHRSSPGDPDPLMLTVEYLVPGAPGDTEHYNLGSDPAHQAWTWRDYRFVVVAAVYNVSMTVAVTRLALEPAQVTASTVTAETAARPYRAPD